MVTKTENLQGQELEGACSYELVMVISPELEEAGIEGMIDSVTRLITGRQGVVSEVERWGKRRLAYPIKHHLEGHYILTRFRLAPEHNRELESNLRISESVIRHLLVKLD